MSIVSLQKANQWGVSIVGAKSYHLSCLLNKGFNVPNGFIITTDAHLAIMEPYASSGSKIREEDISFPNQFVQDLKFEYLQLLEHSEGGSVAVRSSGNMEDLSEASFAGQYITFLEVKTFEQLLDSIKKCWLSAVNEQVLEYMDNKRLDYQQRLAMAILVQQMIHPRAAGVVFTRNPVNGDEEEVMINASIGIGEAVVSGCVTPDLYVISRSRKQLITKELGEKESKLQWLGNTEQWVLTSDQERSSYCLSDSEALQISQLALRIEHEQQYPVDVEFALDNNNLFILQARPITV